MAVLSLSQESFAKEVKKEDSGYVLVDFYAQWCSPCKMIAPLIEEISTLFEGQVKCAKLDVDHAGDIALEYNVSSIPTLMLFHNGVLLDSLMGVVPQSQIEDLMKKHLK